MVQIQTVVGFFDTITEAQQAVQLLLAKGFTAENVALSTPTALNSTTTGDSLPPSIKADDSSGRFFSSLFGSRADSQSPSANLVTVQALSATQAKQVADLLDSAGAGDVAVDEPADPNR
ncbi:hypothetical protein [Spirosoma areae]